MSNGRDGGAVPGPPTRLQRTTASQEAVISAQKPATWAYAESFVEEDPILERARSRGEELGCVPVGTGAGAALRLLAALLPAKSVVEIGTGAGVSGLWLLRGMPADGVLTTIDIEPEDRKSVV